MIEFEVLLDLIRVLLVVDIISEEVGLVGGRLVFVILGLETDQILVGTLPLGEVPVGDNKLVVVLLIVFLLFLLIKVIDIFGIQLLDFVF